MQIFWDCIAAVCGTCIAVAAVSLLVGVILWEFLELKKHSR